MSPVSTAAPPIGLGIAGLGMAGAVMVEAAAAHEGYALRAAADPHPGPRAAFASDFNASVYSDVAGLCADPAVEVVYIATPHQFHAPHAILAAQHGKHIILEKPMALTLADCDAIIAAVERHKVHLIVGHTHAFDPAVRTVFAVVASGALGRLGQIHSFNYTNFLYRPRRPEELDTAQGGGILFNQVPHQIDIVRLLAGGLARSVRAQTTVLDPARPTEGSCAALIAFDNGAVASLVYSGYDYFDSDEWHFGISERGAPKRIDHGAARRALMNTSDEVRARTETFAYGSRSGGLPPHQPHFGVTIVTCERGELRASADGLIQYDVRGATEHQIERMPGMAGRREVLDDMAAALRRGIPPIHDGYWGKATLEVALAIQQSARDRCEVELKDQVPVKLLADDKNSQMAGPSAHCRLACPRHICEGLKSRSFAMNYQPSSHDFVVENPQAQTFFVNREVFVSDDVFEREKRTIFDHCWVYVGHASEIKNPGDFKTRPVAGRPVIFCRDREGVVRALINCCRHRGALVCREREGNARQFYCMYHGWTYHPDGRLKSVPGADAYGTTFDKDEMGLVAVPRLEQYRDFYFANFDRDAVDLDSYLGSAKEYIDLVVDQSPSGKMQIISGTQEYDIRANWKLLVENSVDDYHLISTHSTWLNYMRNSGVNVTPPKGELLPTRGFGKDLGNGHLTTDNPNYRAGRWRAGFRSTARRPRRTSTRCGPSWWLGSAPGVQRA